MSETKYRFHHIARKDGCVWSKKLFPLVAAYFGLDPVHDVLPAYGYEIDGEWVEPDAKIISIWCDSPDGTLGIAASLSIDICEARRNADNLTALLDARKAAMIYNIEQCRKKGPPKCLRR